MINRLFVLAVLSAVGLLSCLEGSAAETFRNETLKYVISYKWGIIHKDAGEATLTLRQNGDRYNIMLTARTKPWADHFYQVRDTLKGSLRIGDLRPLSYYKLTHEKGEYKRDEIIYSYADNVTTGTARRFRKDKNSRDASKWNMTEKRFTASGPVYDMLSVFYYLRRLDYNKMPPEQTYSATIFSGKEKESIRIKCLGKEKIKLRDKTEKESYHIRFNFTRDNGKKSSDDMDTWISVDSDHIPLYLVGKLPVGEVRAYIVEGVSK